VTGEGGNRFREHCKTLGASGYFEKPVDFPALIKAIESAVPNHSPERRAHLRIVMKVALRLVARAENHIFKSEIVTAENVSAGGFLCACTTPLLKDAVVEVYLSGQERPVCGQGSRDPEGSFQRATAKTMVSSSLRRQKTGCSIAAKGRSRSGSQNSAISIHSRKGIAC